MTRVLSDVRGKRVLLVGAGGLGSAAGTLLARAGIGYLEVLDDDVVELSNLQRQVLHGTRDVGRPKVSSAETRLRDLNPHVEIATSIDGGVTWTYSQLRADGGTGSAIGPQIIASQVPTGSGAATKAGAVAAWTDFRANQIDGDIYAAVSH